MADIQVKCISKIPGDATPEGVTHLGGDGWKKTRAEVIALIEGRVNTYYTLVGALAAVRAVDGPNGKILRTHRDGKYNDILLTLPECT